MPTVQKVAPCTAFPGCNTTLDYIPKQTLLTRFFCKHQSSFAIAWLQCLVRYTNVHAGMGDLISVQQRNIEELGFPEHLHGKADGLFLDLPGPWHVSLTASVSCTLQSCIVMCS